MASDFGWGERGAMSNWKHGEAHIIEALKQVEAGRTAAEVGRELGVRKHTFYAWNAKYGGLEVSEAQWRRQLEDENRLLNKLVGDLNLDRDKLRAVIRKTAGTRRDKWRGGVFAVHLRSERT